MNKFKVGNVVRIIGNGDGVSVVLVEEEEEEEEDNPTSPHHYQFPNGAQVIDITRHLGFLEGNIIKYVARAGKKGDKVEDLKKAKQYLDWLIEDSE